jgi:hypothetical protein
MPEATEVWGLVSERWKLRTQIGGHRDPARYFHFSVVPLNSTQISKVATEQYQSDVSRIV